MCNNVVGFYVNFSDSDIDNVSYFIDYFIFDLYGIVFLIVYQFVVYGVEEWGWNKGDCVIVYQMYVYFVVVDVDDFCCEVGIGFGFIVEEMGVQLVGDVVFGYLVEMMVFCYLYGGFILGMCNGFVFNDGFQQMVVDYVVIFMDW